MWVNVFVRHVCSVFICGRGESYKWNVCFYEQKVPLQFGKLAQRNDCGMCDNLGPLLFEEATRGGAIAVFAE